MIQLVIIIYFVCSNFQSYKFICGRFITKSYWYTNVNITSFRQKIRIFYISGENLARIFRLGSTLSCSASSERSKIIAVSLRSVASCRHQPQRL